jgi:hypothetical protein
VREQTGNQPSTPWHPVKTESAKMDGIELAKELLARPQRNATDWAAARCIEAQAALIKELVEALEERLADETNGTSGSYRYAAGLIAKAKAVQS